MSEIQSSGSERISPATSPPSSPSITGSSGDGCGESAGVWRLGPHHWETQGYYEDQWAQAWAAYTETSKSLQAIEGDTRAGIDKYRSQLAWRRDLAWESINWLSNRMVLPEPEQPPPTSPSGPEAERNRPRRSWRAWLSRLAGRGATAST